MIKKQTFLVVVAIFIVFSGFVLMLPRSASAKSPPVIASAGVYCSRYNGETKKNCLAAYNCGHWYWRMSDDNCTFKSNFRGVNLKRLVSRYPGGIIAHAINQGTIDARRLYINNSKKKKKPSNDSSNGGSTSGGSSNSSSDASGSGNNKDKKDSKEAIDSGLPPTLGENNGKNQCGSGDDAVKTHINFGCKGVKYKGPGGAIGDMMFALIRFLSVGVGIAITASIVIAGIQYTTGEGNPEATQAAKQRIQNSVIALMLYVFSFAIIQFLVPGGLF